MQIIKIILPRKIEKCSKYEVSNVEILTRKAHETDVL